jgi:hypothetical protein
MLGNEKTPAGLAASRIVPGVMSGLVISPAHGEENSKTIYIFQGDAAFGRIPGEDIA